VQSLLPDPFPRRVHPAPRDAALFGVLPLIRTGSYDALKVARPPPFNHVAGLAAQMARTVRLDLPYDATPGPANGWPRVIEDILAIAPLRTFRGAPCHSELFMPSDADEGGGRRSRFLAVSVAVGAQGTLD
jgi:hypothetical protein